MSACQIGVLYVFFFDKVNEGSIVIKKSKRFSSSKEGLIIDGDVKSVEKNLVISATGFKGDQKLRSTFQSSTFQNYISKSEKSSVSLYGSGNFDKFWFLIFLI